MDLDPSMQRILDNASAQESHHRKGHGFAFSSVDSKRVGGFTPSGPQNQTRGISGSWSGTRDAEFSFGPAPRQLVQDPMILNDSG